MGTTAQKLTYLNDTKSQLKTMISYGYPLSNETFREYVGGVFKALINSMSNTTNPTWNNLPKITTTASTSQSINNTIEAPMRIELGASELEQFTTTGKQLFDKNVTPKHTSECTLQVLQTGIKLTATYSGTGNWQYCDFILFDLTPYKGKTVRLKSKINKSANTYSYYSLTRCDSSGSNRTTEATSSTSEEIISFTVPQDMGSLNYLRLLFQLNGGSSIVTIGDYVEFTNIILTIDNSDMTYEPYTGGIASPNPNYPQPIHTISGSNKVIVCGSNLTIKNVKGYFNTSATAINVDNNSESFVFYAVEGETYTYSCQETLNRNIIAKVDTLNIVNGTPITNIRTLGQTQTFTSEFTGYCILYVNSTKNENIKNSFMINVGTTALPYTPYVSQEQEVDLGDIEYCKIGNYENKFIRNSGKNKLSKDLFDTSIWNVSGTDSEFTIQAKSSGTVSQNISFNFSNCSFTGTIVYENMNGSVVLREDTTSRATILAVFDNTSGSAVKDLQVSNPVDNLRIVVYSTSSKITFRNCQLESGTTPTDYEPYGSNEWYIKESKIKINLKDITISNFNTTYNRIDGRIFATVGSETNINGLCNVATLKTGISVNSNQTNTIVVREATDRRNFYLWLDGITTLEQAQTYIANTSDYIICQMSIPTYTKITGTLAEQLEAIYNAMSKNGQTNISQINNDLAFNLNVSAIEEI